MKTIICTKKDNDDNIIGCNVYLTLENIISDIESGAQYQVENGKDVHVVHGKYGKYLRTDSDQIEENNLDSIECE